MLRAPVAAQDAAVPIPEACPEPCPRQTPPPTPEGTPEATPEQLAAEGLRYATGNEVPRDAERASGLFRRACDRGHARACSNLGILYRQGVGAIPRDDALAARLFEQACDAGHAAACHHLGVLYEGSANGLVRAVALFRRACEGGHRDACAKLPRGQGSAVASFEASQQPDRCASRASQRRDRLCWTPREGVVSGFLVALDLGILTPSPGPSRRLSLATSVTIAVRAALTFLDQLTVDASYGGILMLTSSSDEIEQGSVVSGDFFNFEGGYQHRFRVTHAQSVTPGLMAGYMHGLGNLTRSLACSDCGEARPTHMNPSGANLSAFVRTTFGRMGRFGMFIRTRWFLTGDLLHDLGVGFEGGLP